VTSGAYQRWWRRTEQFASTLETWLIVSILGGLVVLGAAQIVLRNFFSIGLPWGDGLGRLAVLWLALLGAMAASREGRHITLGAVMRWFPPRLRLALAVIADVLAAVVSGVLAWHSWVFVRDSRAFGDLLLDDIPAWWLQAIMPVAFALMACRFLMHGVRRSLGRVAAGEVVP
jgi:TRAP-type C4-dicarboxylate transport system permease small subunit